ncbi:MAG: hypothetical protein QOD90_1657 [Mycobacterium sp.]|jgi:uncharacterized protein (DUF305 family)|nr:hypothetical protein [Mycobacterium sp.]
MKPYRVALLILFFALMLGACGSAEAPPKASSSTTDEPAITGEPAGFNAGDISFAYNVISHHGQSVELAALVPDRSSNSDLIALASTVSSAQGPERELMRVLLVQWNENPNDDSQQGNAVAGMVDDATVARLQSSRGQEFDTLWLQSMIGHGQGAVAIAEGEIASGTNVDAIATARRMVDSQQAQIGQMQQMLGAG